MCANVGVFSENIYGQLKSELQLELDRIVKDNDLPGITLAIDFDNNHIINIASGFSDIENQIPMFPESRMLSGSVGKMFVSTITLELVESKKLRLEDKISIYLSDKAWFSQLPNQKEITIQNLLNHTSGLPRYIFQKEFLDDIKANPLISRSPESCLSYVLNKPAIHPAGQGWAYSDTNYLVLGLIIESVTGKKYYDLLRKDILEKYKLNSTFPSESMFVNGLIPGYIGEQNFFGLPKKVSENSKMAINPQFEWTGGGVVTNVKDLVRFTKLLHEGKILSEKIYRKLISPVNTVTGKAFDSGYGLGSFVWSKSNDTRYGHKGFFPGYLTHVEYSKNKQYAIAVQINTDEGYEKLDQYIYDLDKVISKYLDAIDEDKIRRSFDRQAHCWNSHDIECYMKAYANEETIQTISNNGIAYKTENILSDYKKRFLNEKMGQLFFDNLNLKRLSDNLYFVSGHFNIKNSGRNNPLQGWFSVNMKRIQGNWFILTNHTS